MLLRAEGIWSHKKSSLQNLNHHSFNFHNFRSLFQNSLNKATMIKYPCFYCCCFNKVSRWLSWWQLLLRSYNGGSSRILPVIYSLMGEKFPQLSVSQKFRNFRSLVQNFQKMGLMNICIEFNIWNSVQVRWQVLKAIL